ncbi:MAG: hypothetical protein D6776_06265 [Planctomycetota bacterium]|nr:MAG: hypothetical protein D6776_06265 [Planctomycetota bacterium]
MGWLRRALVCGMVAGLGGGLAACAAVGHGTRSAVAPSVAPGEVFSAAFAYLVRSGGASAFYLAVHEGERDRDPEAQTVARLAGVRPPVYPASRCEVTDADVRDRVTGRGGGVLLRVERPRWIDDRTAELRVEYRFGRRNTANYRLRLVRTEGGWRIVEEQPLWAGGFGEARSRS